MLWRRERGLMASGALDADAPPSAGFPEDAVRFGTDADGQPTMAVVLRIGELSLASIQQIDELVTWRVRMQEIVCEMLGSAAGAGGTAEAHSWAHQPLGPTYTLILDCRGLRPYHFGRAARRSLKSLTHVLTHYCAPPPAPPRDPSLLTTRAAPTSPAPAPRPRRSRFCRAHDCGPSAGLAARGVVLCLHPHACLVGCTTCQDDRGSGAADGPARLRWA